jgi:hypothetical protein
MSPKLEAAVAVQLVIANPSYYDAANTKSCCTVLVFYSLPPLFCEARFMDLDLRQTRHLFLAGTVAMPTPFPKTGVIALDVLSLTYPERDAVKEGGLMIVDYSDKDVVLRAMRRSHVSALFVNGEWDGEKRRFQVSDKPCVDNFEHGEWFLRGDINEETIYKRLKLDPENDDISTRNSMLRGIAFISEGRPLLQVTECALAAGECHDSDYSCCWRTCCRNY